MQQTSNNHRLYCSLVYIVVFGVITLFWPFAETDTISASLFMVAASAGYAALYCLPAIVLTATVGGLFKIMNKQSTSYRRIVGALVWICSSLVILLVYADYQLYTLYEYHFNSFVWNLLTTPGGIESLGVTRLTQVTVILEVIGFLLLTATLYWLSFLITTKKTLISRSLFVSVFSVMMLVLLGEESVYAYSVYAGKVEYIRASAVIPFKLNSSADSFFKKVGLERTSVRKLRLAQGKVHYPLQPIHTQPQGNDPNVIMLVAESFRSDLLDPEITPNLWAFSQQAINFKNHYSGGNRTRMGMMSMFYGLYAPYWYGFQQQKVAPVLMDTLKQKDYQFALHTSQSFDYPELRDTVFHGMNEVDMQELRQGQPWQRDHKNISDIIDKLAARDKNKLFYGFMFFESTHAPYSFNDDDIVRADYVDELNYAELDLHNKIDQIHNRYINAAHRVDTEVGRLLDYLNQHGMLDNTIVMFTGDHGEEFMEHGHWGHGHNQMFPEQQVHVPLVLWIPGAPPQQDEHRTSHIQIPQTLLEQLGVTTPAEDYTLAGDLSTTLPYLVVGNYNYLAIMNDDFKLTFPFTASDYFHYTLFDRDDNTVRSEDKKAIIDSMQDEIDAVVADSGRFVSKQYLTGMGGSVALP